MALGAPIVSSSKHTPKDLWSMQFGRMVRLHQFVQSVESSYICVELHLLELNQAGTLNASSSIQAAFK